MLILKQIFKLIKLINSEKGKYQIAFGFALGMILGLTPTFGLHTIFFIFLMCILRINPGAVFLSWAFFGIVAFPFDGLFHALGYWLLTDVNSLHGIWTNLYNMPVIPWSNFNNTVMLGSFVAGIILFIPSVFIFGLLIDKYRDRVRDKLMNAKWFKAFKTTKIYLLYKKYEQIKAVAS